MAVVRPAAGGDGLRCGIGLLTRLPFIQAPAVVRSARCRHARARRVQNGELAPTPLESGTRCPHDARQLVAIPPRFARVITSIVPSPKGYARTSVPELD